MPFGPYASFTACVAAQRRRPGIGVEAARRICGRLQADLKKQRFADRPAPEPAWRRLHRQGDRFAARFARVWQDAVAALDRDVSPHLLRAAAEGSVAALTEPLVRLGVRLAQGVAPIFVEAIEAGGHVGAADVVHKQAFAYTFDVDRPQAIAWAEAEAARLVTLVQDEASDALRAVIVHALRRGVAPRQLAAWIRDLKPALGLDRVRAVALERLMQTLVDEGRPPAVIRRIVARQAERFLRQRSLTIARNETLRALGHGQQLAWAQAQAEGLLPPTAVRRWIVTPDDRLCPRCAPQDGLEAIVGQPYRLRPPEGGRELLVPNDLHVQCRCAEGIVAA